MIGEALFGEDTISVWSRRASTQGAFVACGGALATHSEAVSFAYWCLRRVPYAIKYPIAGLEV